MRPHSKLSPFHHLSTLDVTHVKKDTRPSVLQLKTVQAWEQGYCQARAATCTVEQWAALHLSSTLRLTLDSQAHQGQDSLHSPFGMHGIYIYRYMTKKLNELYVYASRNSVSQPCCPQCTLKGMPIPPWQHDTHHHHVWASSRIMNMAISRMGTNSRHCRQCVQRGLPTCTAGWGTTWISIPSKYRGGLSTVLIHWDFDNTHETPKMWSN